jgi:hypothetical protein
MSKSTELELQIQRLVDGELTRPQIQQLLRAAEAEPTMWRELAVAFAEDRILASEARQYARGEAVLPEGASGQDRYDHMNPTAEQHGSPSAWRSAGLWLAAAAMLLCAAGLGFLAGRGGTPSIPSDLLAGKASSPSAATTPASGAYTFQFIDNQGQPIPNASLPLLTEEAAAQLGYNPARAAIPPALQSEFRRAGYELQPEVKFIEGRMNDGRRVTLPYSDLKIRSYGQ